MERLLFVFLPLLIVALSSMGLIRRLFVRAEQFKSDYVGGEQEAYARFTRIGLSYRL